MRNLKTILGIIYPILILLLILLNLKSCGPGEPPSIGEPPAVVSGDTTTITTGEVADSTTIRQVTEIGGMGDLKVTLLWDFYGDIDLHVIQPSGREINYNSAFKRDPLTGGYLDRDNINGGAGAAENIYWKHPPKGQYTVYLHYYGPSRTNYNSGSGICTVVVMQKGEQSKKYEIPMDHKGQIVTVVKINQN